MGLGLVEVLGFFTGALPIGETDFIEVDMRLFS